MIIKFQLLASFCSFSQNIVSQHSDDLNDKDFISIYLQPEIDIQSEVDATFQFLKNGLSTQMIGFLNYLRIITEANYFISALNTNAVMYSAWSSSYQQWNLFGFWNTYDPAGYNGNIAGENLKCNQESPIDSAGFISVATSSYYQNHTRWYKTTSNSTIVTGFFVACTPLEALLQSTLDCLRSISCLQLLTEYFPLLNQVCLIFIYSLFYIIFLFVFYLDTFKSY